MAYITFLAIAVETQAAVYFILPCLFGAPLVGTAVWFLVKYGCTRATIDYGAGEIVRYDSCCVCCVVSRQPLESGGLGAARSDSECCNRPRATSVAMDAYWRAFDTVMRRLPPPDANGNEMQPPNRNSGGVLV